MFLLFVFIEYQNKKHAFNWLNTLHVTFTIPRYRLGCCYRPVQKPWIDLCYGIYTVFGPVYISINRNFKKPSMILIKSTLKMFIRLYARFYLFLKLQFLLRFLDSLEHLYFVYLQFNKHNSYWYREQYQDIQTALVSRYGPWNKYFPRLLLGNIIFTGPCHDPWAVCISWYCPPYQ